MNFIIKEVELQKNVRNYTLRGFNKEVVKDVKDYVIDYIMEREKLNEYLMKKGLKGLQAECRKIGNSWILVNLKNV